MKPFFLIALALFLFGPSSSHAQQKLDSILPVRGFCIDVPRPAGLDSFVRFINDELAPRKVNTLFLLVDYHYQFRTHPELIDSFALSNADVKRIVKACAQHKIRIIPQIACDTCSATPLPK